MNIAILTPVRLLGDTLACYFKGQKDVSVVVVAHSFSVLQEALSQCNADLALIDTAQGIDLVEVRALAAAHPALRLLALGLQAHCKEIVRCGRAGFCSYLCRDASLEELLKAMQDAVEGRLCCPPEVAGELLRALYRDTPPALAPTEALTARECEVLQALSIGLSNKEIARKFGLSPSTIKHHVQKILDKLQVSRRAEAMQRVRDMPWLAGTALAGSLREEA